MSDGTALIQEPFLFAFNKDAKDADGFTAPIKAWAELTYTQDPETRFYIGKEANQKSLRQQYRVCICSLCRRRGSRVKYCKCVCFKDEDLRVRL